jgi:predicted secreted protein
MSQALATTGILVKREGVTVAEIVSVTPPGFSRNKIETSTHNDGTESYVLGILRQKDVAFRVNYLGDDSTHEQLVDDIQNDTLAAWTVLFPSGVQFAGNARVQKFEIVDAPVDAAQQADCGLSWSGPITLTV